jgi:hypothetical protein
MSPNQNGNPIIFEHYLDQLAAELRLDPVRTRRILKEAEDHLHEAAEAALAAGASEADSRRIAIDRFGPPRVVARRFAAEDGRLLPPSLMLQLVLALGLLAGAGMVAIGISGGMAQAMGTLFGQRFVAADINGITYTPVRCAEYRALEPNAGDCASAATAHHFGEVVQYRLAVGVLGLLVLSAYAVIRRRYRYLSGVRVLPDGFTATAGAAVFGLAAALLVLQGLGVLASSGTGAGGSLSGGIVSAVAFLVCLVPLVRTLRNGGRPAGPEVRPAPA